MAPSSATSASRRLRLELLAVVGSAPSEIVDDLRIECLSPVDLDPGLGPVQCGRPIVGLLVTDGCLFVGLEKRQASKRLNADHTPMETLVSSGEMVDEVEAVVGPLG